MIVRTRIVRERIVRERIVRDWTDRDWIGKALIGARKRCLGRESTGPALNGPALSAQVRNGRVLISAGSIAGQKRHDPDWSDPDLSVQGWIGRDWGVLTNPAEDNLAQRGQGQISLA